MVYCIISYYIILCDTYCIILYYRGGPGLGGKLQGVRADRAVLGALPSASRASEVEVSGFAAAGFWAFNYVYVCIYIYIYIYIYI